MALTLFFVPVRFRTLSESETAVRAAETAVSAAETTVFRPLKRPFSYFRTRKRYAKELLLGVLQHLVTRALTRLLEHLVATFHQSGPL